MAAAAANVHPPAWELLSVPADNFVCPITNAVMVDPVVDPEGNSYERSAIENWLGQKGTSPLTRRPMSISELAPNRALRDALLASGAAPDAVAPGTPPNEAAAEPATPPPAALPPVEVNLHATHDGAGTAWVTIEAPEPTDAPPAPVVTCVTIDVSYSMDSGASIAGDSDGDSGLSLLDVVKHATRTIIESLGPRDFLSIVTYSDTGSVELRTTRMDTAGKCAARQTVERLCTTGQTNLWDGLRVAMDELRRAVEQGVVAEAGPRAAPSVLLLTDGMPNCNPPRGITHALNRYKDQNGGLGCELNTFGFGYSLESSILEDIAAEGGGGYSFIPDASFVGTCFVNAVAGLAATAVPAGGVLSVEPAEGAEGRVEVIGGASFGAVGADWGASVPLGAVRYGQTRDFLVRCPPGAAGGIRATLTLPSGCADTRLEARSAAPVPPGSAAEAEIEYHRSRLALVGYLSELLTDQSRDPSSADRGTVNWDKVSDELLAPRAAALAAAAAESGPCVANHPAALALLQDVRGQVCEAVSRREWFDKWGRHYLPSLGRSHALQRCSNFKDPGLQVYGAGALFIKVRDTAEDLFVSLPPPKPSLTTRRGGGVTSMASYHNSGNVCFAAGGVLMADGAVKPLVALARGDRVRTAGGGAAGVECVVRTGVAGGACSLVRLPAPEGATPAVATHWHPVRPAAAGSAAGWQFPMAAGTAQWTDADFVYSFLLSPGAAGILIGPEGADPLTLGEPGAGWFEGASLGHGVTGDAVIEHAYFGSREAVVRDLERMEGWEEGLVTLQPGCAVRDRATGRIVGLEQRPVAPPAPPAVTGVEEEFLARAGSCASEAMLEGKPAAPPSLGRTFSQDMFAALHRPPCAVPLAPPAAEVGLLARAGSCASEALLEGVPTAPPSLGRTFSQDMFAAM